MPVLPASSSWSELWLERRRNRHGEPLKPRTKALYRGILESHMNPTFGLLVLDNNPRQIEHASKVNRTFEPVRATPAEIVER